MHTIIKIAVVSVLALFAIVGMVSISKADDFDFVLSGWEEFRFGEKWSDSKEKLNQRCAYTGAHDDDYRFGRNCGIWNDLYIDVSIIGKSENIFGFGKKLDRIKLTIEYSREAYNKLSNLLKNNFPISFDYNCYVKEENHHWCNTQFSYGMINFTDRLWEHDGSREIEITLSSGRWDYRQYKE